MSDTTTKTVPKKEKMTTVRVYRDLHREVKIQAAKEGRTVDDMVDVLLRKGLEAAEK